MRVSKFCAAALLLSCTLNVAAQRNANLVKLGGNLLSLLSEGVDETVETYGGFSAALEHQLNNKTTLVAAINFNTKETTLLAGNSTFRLRETVVTFEPEFRWYPKAAMRGFYLGVAPAIYQLKATLIGVGNGTEKDTQVGLGLKPGYQFVLTPKLKLQLGTGLGAILPDNNSDIVLQVNLNFLAAYQF